MAYYVFNCLYVFFPLEINKTISGSKERNGVSKSNQDVTKMYWVSTQSFLFLMQCLTKTEPAVDKAHQNIYLAYTGDHYMLLTPAQSDKVIT